jgi:5-methylcytosine-specific restriction endonuclease McrA
MGEPPPALTIERNDNDRGYEPDNCRWPTRAEQTRNRRKSRPRNPLVHSGIGAAAVRKIVIGQKSKCWWCGKKLGKSYHIDHRIPLAKGGADSPSNAVAACVSCNTSKGAKMPWQFAGRLL